MKYFVKRTNEREEFSFTATLEEVEAGYKSGQIAPEWGVRKETDGAFDWITVQELCAPEASPPASASSSSFRRYGWVFFAFVVLIPAVGGGRGFGAAGDVFVFLCFVAGVIWVISLFFKKSSTEQSDNTNDSRDKR
jgi:hypothetical protein